MSDDDEILAREDSQLFKCEVINLADVRVRFGKAKKPNNCKHYKLIYDSTEKRVWCEACEKSIDNFDAFLVLVDNFTAMIKHVKRWENEVKEALEHNITSRATKRLDEAWRSHKSVPCCPHCSEALLPEDFIKNGYMRKSKALEYQRRQKQSKTDTTNPGKE